MLHPLPITPAARALASTITPPGSKSLSNRALLAAALADAESRLAGLLDCEDTRLMGQALKTLGLKLELDWERGQASVTGGGGHFPTQTAQLSCGNRGSTSRFLAAA
ncbi:MAG: 3-phosphoshikimate 1-carboxyvinyltransferase, partial [Planctomycetota bacterium]